MEANLARKQQQTSSIFMQKSIVIDTKSVRQALRCWDSTRKLSQVDLVYLRRLDQWRLQQGYSDSETGRGVALRDLLQSGIDALRPNQSSIDYGDKQWRSYVVLLERFVNRRKVEWIAEQLFISRRTYYQEQERALQLLADWLSVQEENVWKSAETNPAQQPKFTHVPHLAPPPLPHALIGRAEIYQQLFNALSAYKTIATHGLPGTGKTSLAITLANDPAIIEQFSDGILWVSLGQNPDVLALLSEWGLALGLSDRRIAQLPSVPELAKAIHSVIGRKKMLLVIDDVWDSNLGVIFRLGGPHCAHLLTSRLYKVALDIAVDSTLLLPELNPADGLALLREWVPALVDGNQEAAIQLVKLVGSLPLALILMGRHLRKHSYTGQSRRLRRTVQQLQSIETRLHLTQPQSPLSQRSDLPFGASVSLVAVIGISEGLLDAAAKQLWYTLALLPPKPNSFSEEAAMVLGGNSAESLDTLVDHGLIECIGEDRYMMHQTISDYARFASQQTPDSHQHQRRHLIDYFTTYLKENQYKHQMLTVEFRNIQTAFDMACKLDQHQYFFDSLDLFCNLLTLRGLLAEVEYYLNLASSRLTPNDELHRATINKTYGIITYWREQYEQAHGYLIRALQHAVSAGSIQQQIRCYRHLSIKETLRSNYDMSRLYTQKALDLCEHINDQHLLSIIQLLHGTNYYHGGQFEEAETVFVPIKQYFEQHNNLHYASKVLLNLGIIYSYQGRFEKAIQHLRQALTYKQMVNDTIGIAPIINSLANIMSRQGDFERSIAHYEQALQLSRTMEMTRREAMCLHNLGSASLRIGNYERAYQLLMQAWQIRQSINNHAGIFSTRYMLFGVYPFSQGDLVTAVKQMELSLQSIKINEGIYSHFCYEYGRIMLAANEIDKVERLMQCILLDKQLGWSRWHRLYQAILAVCRWRRGLYESALADVTNILAEYAQSPTLGRDEPGLFWYCYQVLEPANDSRANEVLQQAYFKVQEIAEMLHDDTYRQSFLETYFCKQIVEEVKMRRLFERPMLAQQKIPPEVDGHFEANYLSLRVQARKISNKGT